MKLLCSWSCTGVEEVKGKGMRIRCIYYRGLSSESLVVVTAEVESWTTS